MKQGNKKSSGVKVGRGLDKIWKRGLDYIGGFYREVIRKIRNPVPAMTYIDIFT